MENENLYELGKKTQKGDEIALAKIINKKRKMIEKYSYWSFYLILWKGELRCF